MYSPRMRGGQPGANGRLNPKNKFSPYARGSTPVHHSKHILERILPACAGVNLMMTQRHTKSKNSPRMRGGQPCAAPSLACHSRFFPHARGSTRPFRVGYSAESILPACAGVNPAPPVLSKGISDSPRMRGGHPNFGCWKSKHTQFTPHARGSTQPRQFSLFPCNGIHPACAGGQPFSSIGLSMVLVYTPHVRGSTHVDIRELAPMEILPARAGVNPLSS